LDVPLQVLEGAKVGRRGFISGIAGTTIAPIVAADLIQSGFAAALRNGYPTADEWQAKVVSYGRDYMSLGASDIQNRLASDLVILQQQLDNPDLWSVAARLMTVYGKTIPGSDGSKAVQWYRMAATAADRSGDEGSRIWVRGRAAIALGYEGACLPVAECFANQALAISDKPSLGSLNALMAKAHVATTFRKDTRTALQLLARSQRVFDVVGSYDQMSDFAVPEWRIAVFSSLLLARLGEERSALDAQDVAVRNLPDSLPRFATHIELHRGLMLARSGDRPEGVDYARAALAKLPLERHSLTLRVLLAEIERTLQEERD
jgi:hypothetical protein